MWMKLDDRIPRHPKFMGIPAGAMGLWAMCGTWAAGEENGGAVPGNVAQALAAMMGCDLAVCAAELVSRGLWEPDADGWRFHDWHDSNPTPEQLADRRRSDRDRQRRHRDTTPVTDPSRRDTDVTDGTVTDPSRRDPRDPEPEPDTRREEPDGSSRTRASGGPDAPPPDPPPPPDPARGLADEFAEWWLAWPKKAGRKAALAAYRRARSRAPAEALLDAARRLAAWPHLPEPRFVPDPATWLNQDRWGDDLAHRYPPPRAQPPPTPARTSGIAALQAIIDRGGDP